MTTLHWVFSMDNTSPCTVFLSYFDAIEYYICRNKKEATLVRFITNAVEAMRALENHRVNSPTLLDNSCAVIYSPSLLFL